MFFTGKNGHGHGKENMSKSTTFFLGVEIVEYNESYATLHIFKVENAIRGLSKLNYCFVKGFNIIINGQRQQQHLLIKNNFLRGNCTPNQKLACFAFHLKNFQHFCAT